MSKSVNRRTLFANFGTGIGGLALASILSDSIQGSKPVSRSSIDSSSLAPHSTHRSARATSVIQLFMHGGPSHVDLLDPKPALDRFDGTNPPAEILDDEQRTQYLLKSPFRFKPHGESGVAFSEIMPNVAKHADDIAVIRSMFTEHRNHEQAIWMAQTGLITSGRPNIASWITYALGSENQNLPAYVVLPDPSGLPVDGIRNWSSGWLPPVFQGTPFRSDGVPVLHLTPKASRSQTIRESRLKLLRKLNLNHQKKRPSEQDLEARIASFELAARMQLRASDALDVRQESAKIQSLYGLDNPTTASYGLRCLMARRLVERGVRFVQLFMKGQPWDTHTQNTKGLRSCCAQTDPPIGALLSDLKRRGLLDTTLVLWGGEFGRTPGAELRGNNVTKGNEGRDHHPYGFSVWAAGGGIQGGQVRGATDDFGYRSIVDRTQTADLHATILHLMGLDHDLLTYQHNGRSERLTDVYKANVLHSLLA